MDDEFCYDLESQFGSLSLAERSGQYPLYNPRQVKFYLFFLIPFIIHPILEKINIPISQQKHLCKKTAKLEILDFSSTEQTPW